MKNALYKVFATITFCFIFLWASSSVYATPGGLLDGKIMYKGHTLTDKNNSTSAWTDNDESTSLHLTPYYKYGWHDFNTVLSGINKIAINSSLDVDIVFYDEKSKPIYSFTYVKDKSTTGLQFIKLPQQVNNVKKVSLVSNQSSQLFISEFDVFNTKSQAITDLVAEGGDSKVVLKWSPIPEATSYRVLKSTTSGGPYKTVTDAVYNTSFTDLDVTNGTTYYYIVTAITTSGESEYSNEASATPQTGVPDPEPTGDRAILTITMTTGLEKEYDLSIGEVTDFLNWYDAKDAGTGPAKYAIDRHSNNKGPFNKRTDYVIFNNILTFEVNEYTTATPAANK